ncbi:MAG: DUF2075 domain-containing protein [Acetobacteraceae bacterium]
MSDEHDPAASPVSTPAFWSGTVADFITTPDAEILGRLAQAQITHFRQAEAQQLRAWEATISMLRRALATLPEARTWWVLLEYPLLRLGRRPDVILLAQHAIFVIEVKAGSKDHAPEDRRQIEDYAIDLHDFRAGCRVNPIVPILLAECASPPRQALPLLLGHGVTPVIDANAATLPKLLKDLHAGTSRGAAPLDPVAWLDAPYRPVPTIVDAAGMLYARHNVADIRAARTDAVNLRATSDAILREIDHARIHDQRVILFVTGIPGAGKTLSGLNTIFGTEDAGRGTYLTGNPTLVHVLREALSRDAVDAGAKRSDARRRMESAVQALPKFRDHYVSRAAHVPSERIIVIDEAQRCWSAAWAIAKTRDKAVPLSQSEPAHLLGTMARHTGFAAIVCLVGGGQEIHAGEGGMAEWGAALRAAAVDGVVWQVRAPPDLQSVADPRQRLGALPHVAIIADLHLTVPLRQIRSRAAASWVDFVLAGDAEGAAAIARQAGDLPFRVTRDAAVMRVWLRDSARGLRRAGLLASSGAARLRAEGFGAELPHMDASAVARWFLDRFPQDVRASDALEVIATEFSCQGLELDYVGLCWDADFIREPGRVAWRVRSFRGTDWTIPRQDEVIANQINTYRVLLTRARYETIIFVPRGDGQDLTRPPEIYDRIAAFLIASGAHIAEAMPIVPEPISGPPVRWQPMLL